MPRVSRTPGLGNLYDHPHKMSAVCVLSSLWHELLGHMHMQTRVAPPAETVRAEKVPFLLQTSKKDHQQVMNDLMEIPHFTHLFTIVILIAFRTRKEVNKLTDSVMMPPPRTRRP